MLLGSTVLMDMGPGPTGAYPWANLQFLPDLKTSLGRKQRYSTISLFPMTQSWPGGVCF